MPDAAFDALPAALQTLNTRPLFVMRLAVKPILAVSPQRRVGVVPGGTFAGERLNGEVLDGGVDWQTVSADGGITGLDVRLVLKTDDGALIGMTYQGRRHGPPEVLARLAKGEAVDPSEYYFRIHGGFETGAERYAWLNGVVAVGTGHRPPEGPIYSLFELL